MRRRLAAVLCAAFTISAAFVAVPTSVLAVEPPSAEIFHGLTPARLLETRNSSPGTVDDDFENGGVIGTAATLSLDIAGRGGVPNSAGAVALNVTAINPTANSYVTVYPTGETRPTASNLNLAAGRTMPNMVIVPLGDNGYVDIYNNAGETHMAVDVLGWFPASDGTFGGLTPARLVETRNSSPGTIDDMHENTGVLGAATTLEVDIAGRGGVPDTAGAVALNVTAIAPTTNSYITVYPTGETRPTASNLNLAAGRTLPNMVIVPLGDNGHIDIYNNAGETHLAVDVLGWFPTADTAFTGLTPARLLETRNSSPGTIDDLHENTGVLGATSTTEILIGGRAGVPADAAAVALNVTAIAPTTNSYITVYPTGETRPTASNLNLAAGRTAPNMVIVPLGDNGHIDIYNNAGETHLAVDVLGWFPAGAPLSIVSVTSAEELGGAGSFQPEISGNGQYVTFYSGAQLVASDTNAIDDVYVRDLQNGTTERVSVSTAGVAANNGTYPGEITDDGRYVTFYGNPTNLTANDTNTNWDVYVRDRQTNETTVVSRNTAGTLGNDTSTSPSISDDGRYVVFATDATNFAGDDTNEMYDIVLHDRQTGTSTIISRSSGGTLSNGASDYPRISGNGEFVVYESVATNLVAGDTNNKKDIFAYEVDTQQTTRVSLDSDEVQANDFNELARISHDGRYVSFVCYGTNLDPVKTDGNGDICLRDRTLGTTTVVSRGVGDTNSNNGCYYNHVSSDGSTVVFESYATNLTTPGTGGNSEVFLYDVTTGHISLVSAKASGEESGNFHAYATVSDNGQRIVFMSDGALLPEDDNNQRDIYLYDRT